MSTPHTVHDQYAPAPKEAVEDLKRLEFLVTGFVTISNFLVIGASNLPSSAQTYCKVEFYGQCFRTSLFGESNNPQWDETSPPLYFI